MALGGCTVLSAFSYKQPQSHACRDAPPKGNDNSTPPWPEGRYRPFLGATAEDFNDPDLVSAIRGAQADTVRYPEFVGRSTAAGVIGYWALLTGKRVIYLGRKGEQHIEEFPKPQQ